MSRITPSAGSGSRLDSNAIREKFAKAMAEMYSDEVGLYEDLVRITRDSNREYEAREIARIQQERHVDEAQARLILEETTGPLDRVDGEKHGAIRLGSLGELSQIARVFRVMGMEPVEFYNLGAAGGAAPAISTAFRPINQDELNVNPFRVFTSVLDLGALGKDKLDAKRAKRETFTAEDRALRAQLDKIQTDIIDQRKIFPSSHGERTSSLQDTELGRLVNLFHDRLRLRDEEEHGLTEGEADRFVELAVQVFKMSEEMAVDADTYLMLKKLHPVAADILGMPTPHINHLTPRAHDILDVYNRMAEEGKSKNAKMLATIEGPPTDLNPLVLLNQTAYVAKPSWVLPKGTLSNPVLQNRRNDIALALGLIVTSLQAAGVRAEYNGDLTLEKFGLALDNAGYDLKRLFSKVGDKTRESFAGEAFPTAFTLRQVVSGLMQEIPTLEIDINDIPDVQIIAHSARFGEIEARGVALTPDARKIYEDTLTVAKKAFQDEIELAKSLYKAGVKGGRNPAPINTNTNGIYQRLASPLFEATALSAPDTAKPFDHLVENDLAYFTFHATDKPLSDLDRRQTIVRLQNTTSAERSSLAAAMWPLVEAGVLTFKPVVYEDFLPKSAAGIFLGNQGREDTGAGTAQITASVDDPKLQRFLDYNVAPYSAYNLYAAQEAASIIKAIGIERLKGEPGLPGVEDVAAMLDARVTNRDVKLKFNAPDQVKEANIIAGPRRDNAMEVC